MISDGKTIMYEKSFLKDVAYQNFARYEVQYRLKTPVIVSFVSPASLLVFLFLFLFLIVNKV